MNSLVVVFFSSLLSIVANFLISSCSSMKSPVMCQFGNTNYFVVLFIVGINSTFPALVSHLGSLRVHGTESLVVLTLSLIMNDYSASQMTCESVPTDVLS